MSEIEHPDYYGGENNTYEAIKVIEAWELNFCMGNVIKYIARAGKKTEDRIMDLKKAQFYLQHEIDRMESNTPDTCLPIAKPDDKPSLTILSDSQSGRAYAGIDSHETVFQPYTTISSGGISEHGPSD